jgi:large subunit ribosomal protein L31
MEGTRIMRTGIHPEYVECKVHCSCGAEFTTRSTKPTLQIELCSQCHPFYTGKQKFVDTGGRVQRFADKYAGSKDTVITKAAAEKEARQKAHEESQAAAKAVRAAKDAAEAEKARKEAARAPKAKAEPVAEEAPAQETVESFEEAPVDEAPVEEPAADTEAAEAPATEEPAAEESAE